VTEVRQAMATDVIVPERRVELGEIVDRAVRLVGPVQACECLSEFPVGAWLGVRVPLSYDPDPVAGCAKSRTSSSSTRTASRGRQPELVKQALRR
jgi:hypothetical protein